MREMDEMMVGTEIRWTVRIAGSMMTMAGSMMTMPTTSLSEARLAISLRVAISTTARVVRTLTRDGMMVIRHTGSVRGHGKSTGRHVGTEALMGASEKGRERNRTNRLCQALLQRP